jgi:hypothetical protein
MLLTLACTGIGCRSKTGRDPQMDALNEVTDLLPDTVLLDFVRAQIPSNDKLWTFRKHLAVQYACQVPRDISAPICVYI